MFHGLYTVGAAMQILELNPVHKTSLYLLLRSLIIICFILAKSKERLQFSIVHEKQFTRSLNPHDNSVVSLKNKAKVRGTRKRYWWPQALPMKLQLYKFRLFYGVTWLLCTKSQRETQAHWQSINGVTSQGHKGCVMNPHETLFSQGSLFIFYRQTSVFFCVHIRRILCYSLI